MFEEDFEKAQADTNFSFVFEVISSVRKDRIDWMASQVLFSADFITIQLRSVENKCCPIDIYLGINKSQSYYSIFFNVKAGVYVYEKFEKDKDFGKELSYFLSRPIQEEIVLDNKGNKIYSDFSVKSLDESPPLSFRMYYNKTWINFWKSRKRKKIIKSYFSWL